MSLAPSDSLNGNAINTSTITYIPQQRLTISQNGALATDLLTIVMAMLGKMIYPQYPTWDKNDLDTWGSGATDCIVGNFLSRDVTIIIIPCNPDGSNVPQCLSAADITNAFGGLRVLAANYGLLLRVFSDMYTVHIQGTPMINEKNESIAVDNLMGKTITVTQSENEYRVGVSQNTTKQVESQCANFINRTRENLLVAIREVYSSNLNKAIKAVVSANCDTPDSSLHEVVINPKATATVKLPTDNFMLVVLERPEVRDESGNLISPASPLQPGFQKDNFNELYRKVIRAGDVINLAYTVNREVTGVKSIVGRSILVDQVNIVPCLAPATTR